MIRQFELVEMVRAYNPGANEDLLNRAYVFGVKAHGEQTRASGEPYFNHPVEVAAILTELRLDDATIVTALLHDTIEDTDATPEVLRDNFGEEITYLVEGVTKLSKLKLASKEAAQAENFRKLVLAMAQDPRVLLVKLADRQHNMRTIGHLRPDKRARIARETIEIFAPLASRMGMQKMCDELEDLAFNVLRPDARQSILKRFAHLKRTHGVSIAPQIVLAVKEKLDAASVQADVYGREKRPYSIWRKMQDKRVSFEQLSDIIAFRVLVDNEADCYRALGVIHQSWRSIPGRFKDYISGPKSNGYRSLHTTVVGPNGARIEVQIRTRQMHDVAETGVAAHWAYKGGVRSENPFAVDPHRWLRRLVDSDQTAADDAQEFLTETKMEMRFDQVFCFTPKGEVIELPQGATALDFAYAIHTDVGHSAVGAKVNGARAPLWTTLRNGQSIEILQSDGARPSPVWREMVKTGRARAAIRRTLREQERDDAAAFGGKIVQDAFERAGVAYSMKAMQTAAGKLGHADGKALLAEVGAGRVTAARALEAVYPERATPAGEIALRGEGTSIEVAVTRRGAAPDEEAPLVMPTAPCCRPLPGERVVALREPRKGFRLHAIDCDILAAFEGAMERWLDVNWSSQAGERPENMVSIALLLVNEPGALGQICTLIGSSGANIADMSFVDRKPDYFTLRMALEVRDIRHLNNLLTTLSAQPIVTDARRVREPEHAALAALEAGQDRLGQTIDDDAVEDGAPSEATDPEGERSSKGMRHDQRALL